MRTFRWPTRLRYGLLAGLAGWVAGCVVTFPFEVIVAWRYVDGQAHQLPLALAQGLLVWGAFSLLMATAGFLPVALPLFLFLPPAWIVRRRRILIPAVGVAAMLAIYDRMGLLHSYHFRHPEDLRAFFVTAPNFFIFSFAVVTAWAYTLLAQRHLGRLGDDD